MEAIPKSTRDALSGIAGGRIGSAAGLALGDSAVEGTGLDERTFSLVKVASLIALDAPPASYALQVTAALEAGATSEEIVGVLRAVAPQVGAAKVVAAAPEIMLALGLDLPERAAD